MTIDVEIPAPDYVLPDGFDLVYSGKVRDLWSTPSGDLLFVATDRISAYDYILPTRIPDKGKILTAVSLWWFDRLADLVPNHVLSLDVPGAVLGRAMVCQRLEMLPVECVARGYLTGSGLVDYQRTGAVCGVELPPDLVDGSRLPDPIFTPATKAAIGDHDENIDFAAVEATVGASTAEALRRVTLAVYTRAEGLARSRGLLLADTKFEFGRTSDKPDELVLADEVLTPDSSRWWPVESYEPGRAQPSFDKQFVRDYLETLDWDKTPPGPELPQEIIDKTAAKYREAEQRLTGRGQG